MMRHKVGWFIPQQILALTHLAPEVTQEDFIEIMSMTQACLAEVEHPFHLIIDNRSIKSEQVVSLDIILQSMPQLQSLPLGWIVMILPYVVREKANTRDTQHVGDIHLQYVDSLAAALEVLHAIDPALNWEAQAVDFFAADITQDH
jgi:hypothetical protein